MPHRAAPWRAEIVATARLALPMALTQLGQIAMLTTDVLMLGRLGEDAVAAASLGMNFYFVVFICGMGIVTATAPLAAQAFGARDPRGLRRVIRQGLWAALIVGVPFSTAQAYGVPILVALDQNPKLAVMAGQYLDTLLWCTVPALWLIVLRNFISALNRPRSAMWIMLAGIPLNALLVWIFVFGKFGLPAMGMAGAGLATTAVQFAMLAAQLAVVLWLRPFRRYHVLGRFWRADWRRLAAIFRLGLPISAMLLLEAGVFVAAVVLTGWLGTVPLASHQIAVQIASLTFMVPFGIAQAATVRVGHAVGRRDEAGARRAGYAALGLGIGFMACMALLVGAFRHDLPRIFIDVTKGEGPAVVALTATLLLCAALFQIFDGAQAIAAGALRGRNDTRAPMLIAACSYWLVGFSLAYALGIAGGAGAVGVWIGLSAGLAAAAILLTARHYRLARSAVSTVGPSAAA